MLVCYASGCTTQPAVISLVALQEDAAAIRARLMSGLPLEHLLHASKVNVTANTKQIYHKSYVIGTSEEHVIHLIDFFFLPLTSFVEVRNIKGERDVML